MPPGKTENFTLIEFSIFAGRSLEAKRKLYALLFERVGELGIGPRDPPASEIDLGFNLKV